ncbi:MAG: DUF4407 domain-containing protein [Chitinophagaceae bacterium]|nr:DUF4407 domain-containing protein [Chitinophagaceae bacterium]
MQLFTQGAEAHGAYGRFTRFLWWLATVEEPLIKDCIVDRNRYAIIGASVLGTWVFATLAWSFFFNTVTSIIPAILLGILMGLIVLGIDRALIKSIRHTNRNHILAILFRGLLAVMIGLFMAQPALLFLFDKEVRVQASIDNEHRKQKKRAELEKLFAPQKTALLTQQKQLQGELNTVYAEMSKARIDFIAETDGTGGSGKIGLKDIAEAKRTEYQVLTNRYTALENRNRPTLLLVEKSLAAIEANMLKEQESFALLLNTGFITRIEALNNLVQQNNAVAFRYYLLVGILLLIELMPLISKLMMPTGTYEVKARLVEEEEIRVISQ